MEDTPEKENPEEEEKPEADAPEDQDNSKEEESDELSPDEEIEAAVLESDVQAEKQKQKKKRMKLGIAAGVILLLAYGVHLGLKPRRGTMKYGICRVFLELTVRYPNTLRFSKVQERGMKVEMWYTQTDSFGAYRMEPIECIFDKDEEKGLQLKKVMIRRRELPQDQIDLFNKTIPVIRAHPPPLEYPPKLPDSLKGLKFETDMFRKPIL